jgi:general secretion pathway protein G
MNRFSPRRRSGFTLIEVLMVLVILVIIMSVAVGTYVNTLKKARIDAARSQIGAFKSPLSVYELHMGSFPTTAQGLQALVNHPNDASAGNWNGPYLDSVPLDPWSRPYQYCSPGRYHPDYDVWSLGPDGVDGTSDDIGN